MEKHQSLLDKIEGLIDGMSNMSLRLDNSSDSENDDDINI